MRRLISAFGLLALVLLFARPAAAQNTGQIIGEVKNLEGKPYPEVSVEIKSPDTGKVVNTKTDKQGRFTQLGLPAGLYEIRLTNEKDKLDFKVQFRVLSGQDNPFALNLKEVMAKQGPSAEEMKKKEEEENKFKNMKQHFDAGMAALNDSTNLRAQLKSAPADQRGSIKEKLNASSQTAVTELAAAEQGVPAKDVGTRATVLSNLGQAYELADRNEEAAAAFQKAIEIRPSASFYDHLSLNLVSVGASSTDPKVFQDKLTQATAACDKVAEIDPTKAAACWRNMGAVLTNKGRLKEAIAPLLKATQADPKDPLGWYLLGGAYSAAIETKQQGEKIIYTIPPGTTEAYQKVIDLAPTSALAAQSKDVLAGLASMSSGEETAIGKKPAKKK
jgi:tetratricopeptide (TPR) repeat protein